MVSKAEPNPNFTGFSTKAIHIGHEKQPISGALLPPISMCVAYDSETNTDYSNGSNSTRETLEKVMCALEKAKYSFVLPSGNAAGSFITHILKPGDHILATQDMYGGLINYFDNLATPVIDYKVSYVNFDNREEFLNSFTPQTKIVWLESPTNPLLKIYDIAEISKICHEKGVLLIFDNTFFSPYLLNPLDLGADIVLHSGTKYIGGHSDIMMGFVCVNNEELGKRFSKLYYQYGSFPSPMECFFALRGLKTLAVRMKRAQQNAQRLAEWLVKHPQVEQVYYPGLPTHQGYEINKKQARGTGAMLSFRLKGADLKTSTIFCKTMKVFTYAGSLGGVEGLICTPFNFTHGMATPEFKLKVGVTENLVRLSLGIEDYEDIERDFVNAFKAIEKS